MECRYSGTNLARKEAQIPVLRSAQFLIFEVCAQAQSSIWQKENVFVFVYQIYGCNEKYSTNFAIDQLYVCCLSKEKDYIIGSKLPDDTEHQLERMEQESYFWC